MNDLPIKYAAYRFRIALKSGSDTLLRNCALIPSGAFRMYMYCCSRKRPAKWKMMVTAYMADTAR